MAYEKKAFDKEAKKDATQKCYLFDLQQCLQTPFYVLQSHFTNASCGPLT